MQIGMQWRRFSSAGNTRDTDVIPESGRSPGVGNSNPLQDSCLENPMTEESVWLHSMGLQEADLTDRVHTHSTFSCLASLMAHLVKNLPAMRETWVQSLGWEDPAEKGKTIRFSILAWRLHRLYSP